MKKLEPSKQENDKIIARINTTDLTPGIKHTKPILGVKLSEQQVRQFTGIVQSIARAYTPLIKTEVFKPTSLNTQLSKTLQAASQSAIDAVNSIFKSSGWLDQIQQMTKSFTKLTTGLKAHFPDNWPPGEMKNCDQLCMQGVPIIFVPRANIVKKIAQAKSMKGIKISLVKNDTEIIEDCEHAIKESQWLTKDMRSQIQESIDSYKDKRYRAAQSTATVVFDCLLDEIIDMRRWRQANNNPGALSARKVKQLTDEFSGNLMELPLSRAPFYTLLMFPIIGQMLATFEIGDKSSYTNNTNRNMSVHTVSAKQYKQSNALLTIMTVASICKITELRGKNWMQLSAKEYNVGLS